MAALTVIALSTAKTGFEADTIANLQIGNAFADFRHDTCAFMSQNKIAIDNKVTDTAKL